MSNPNSLSTGNFDNADNAGNTGNAGNSGNSGNSGARFREQRSNRIDNFPPGKCICGRSDALVVCNACGFFKTGRVRYPCPVHHQILYVTDIVECQKCKADYNSLSEVEI